eukprot:TRINITY_DN3274_c0_g1_i1.p1 TRINITY_DN3274_c0_g1~~TRINITY_DN3274_c0_g1_i1.p1  ORF type:complete len:1331 (+),score=237.55 TRINITY_DN3274_c0_g1_i1:4942-8934(+)
MNQRVLCSSPWSVNGQFNGLDLGTSFNGNEIIAGGIIDLIWTQTFRAFLSEEGSLRLYIKNTGAPLTVKKFVLESPHVNGSIVCNPYAKGLNDGFVVPSNSTLIEIVHNCTSGGLAYMNLEFEFGLFDVVYLGWQVAIGNFRNGFMVGTSPKFGDIVKDSIPLPLWSPLTYSRVYGPQMDNTTFHIYCTNGTINFNPKIAYFPEDIASLQITGSGANGGIATDTPLSIEISYSCYKVGTVSILVILDLDGYTNVKFGFRKECLVTDKSFNIGTNEGWSDVVHNGVSTLMWSPGIHTAFVAPDALSTQFWITISGGGSQVIESYNVTANPPICNPYLEGDIDIITGSTQFKVVYNCLQGNATDITVSFDLPVVFRPIVFTWKKKVRFGDEGLIVGVSPHSKEVILDGKITPAYHPKLFSAFVLGSVLSRTFYIGLSKPGHVLEVQKIIAFAEAPNEGACIPFVTGDIASGGDLSFDTSLPFTVVFNCVGEVQSVIAVNITVNGEDPIIFKFTKRVGGPREYLSVGTTERWRDVVNNGVALPLWNPSIGGSNSFSGDVKNITFYLRMEKEINQVYLSPVVNVLPDDVLSPSILPPVNRGGVLTSNITEMVIEFNCNLPQTASVTVILSVIPFKEVVWSWTKVCGLPKIGLMVGTSETDYTVAVNGQTTLKWKNIPDFVYQFDNNTLSSKFYFKESFGSQAISGISLSSSPHCSPYISGNLTQVTRTPQILEVVYNCSHFGIASINLNVSLPGALLPINMYWDKSIGGYRNSLTVGTTEGGSDVAKNGVVLPKWNPTSEDKTVIGKDIPSIKFFFYLKNDTNPLTNTQLISSKKYSVSNDIFWLQIEDSIQVISEKEQYIQLTYNCLAPYTSHVSLEVNFLDFEPLNIEHVKECPPVKTNLMVGTTKEIGDVVSNGIFTPSWSVQNHTVSVDGNTFYSTFYVWTEDKESYDVTTSIFSNNNYCTFESTKLDSISSTPQKLEVYYKCSTQGETVITFAIDIPGYSSASFTWVKEIGGIRTGFNVGTAPYLKDVIRNGVVEKEWSGEGLTLGQWDWSQSFFFWVDDPLYPYQEFLSPAIYSLCGFNIEGTANQSGTAGSNSTEFIVVFFNCVDEGTISFGMELEIPPFDPFQISWRKKSNGLRLGIDLRSDTQPYLGGQDIYINGEIQSNWKLSATSYSNAAFLKTKNMSFTLTMENNKYLKKQIETVVVGKAFTTTTGENCTVSIIGDGGKLSASEDISFSAYSDCVSQDQVGVIFNIPLEGFKPMQFYFSLEPPNEPSPPVGPVILYVALGIVGLVVLIGAISCCCLKNAEKSQRKPLLDLDDELFGNTPSGF